MIRYFGLYFVGLVISVFFLDVVINFINTRILNITLISTQVNDYFQLGLRIFISYFFGAAYFFFKIQRLKITLSVRQIIFSIIGLILLLIVIDFLQVLITLKILGREQIGTRSILALWLTFPCIILYFGVLLKYGYRRTDIKWFW